VLKIRRLPPRSVKEPADKSTFNYTDLHRSTVAWLVIVTPALPLEPKTWWYPVAGRVSYRGYFKEASAGVTWRMGKAGIGMWMSGLLKRIRPGWFRDPVLTLLFMNRNPNCRAYFHELGHRRLYLAGDTDFNEAFATAVAEEAFAGGTPRRRSQGV